MTKFKHGWKPDRVDHRDFLYRKLSAPGLQQAEAVDLRSQCSPVEDQGDLGSCTANSSAAALEFIQLKSGFSLVTRSRLFIYFNGRVIENDPDQDNGCELRDIIKGLASRGSCPEVMWPYNISQFAQTPPPNCFANALTNLITSYHRLLSLDDMLNCLSEGFPFVFGFNVYSSFESDEVAKTGIVNMPASDEENLGGHAVLCVGYDKATQRFLVKNSWGPNWGQEGYFTIPFEYLESLADDFWTIRQ